MPPAVIVGPADTARSAAERAVDFGSLGRMTRRRTHSKASFTTGVSSPHTDGRSALAWVPAGRLREPVGGAIGMAAVSFSDDVVVILRMLTR